MKQELLEKEAITTQEIAGQLHEQGHNHGHDTHVGCSVHLEGCNGDHGEHLDLGHEHNHTENAPVVKCELGHENCGDDHSLHNHSDHIDHGREVHDHANDLHEKVKGEVHVSCKVHGEGCNGHHHEHLEHGDHKTIDHHQSHVHDHHTEEKHHDIKKEETAQPSLSQEQIQEYAKADRQLQEQAARQELEKLHERNDKDKDIEMKQDESVDEIASRRAKTTLSSIDKPIILSAKAQKKKPIPTITTPKKTEAKTITEKNLADNESTLVDFIEDPEDLAANYEITDDVMSHDLVTTTETEIAPFGIAGEDEETTSTFSEITDDTGFDEAPEIVQTVEPTLQGEFEAVEEKITDIELEQTITLEVVDSNPATEPLDTIEATDTIVNSREKIEEESDIKEFVNSLDDKIFEAIEKQKISSSSSEPKLATSEFEERISETISDLESLVSSKNINKETLVKLFVEAIDKTEISLSEEETVFYINSYGLKFVVEVLERLKNIESYKTDFRQLSYTNNQKDSVLVKIGRLAVQLLSNNHRVAANA